MGRKPKNLICELIQEVGMELNDEYFTYVDSEGKHAIVEKERNLMKTEFMYYSVIPTIIPHKFVVEGQKNGLRRFGLINAASTRFLIKLQYLDGFLGQQNHILILTNANFVVVYDTDGNCLAKNIMMKNSEIEILKEYINTPNDKKEEFLLNRDDISINLAVVLYVIITGEMEYAVSSVEKEGNYLKALNGYFNKIEDVMKECSSYVKDCSLKDFKRQFKALTGKDLDKELEYRGV